MSFMSNAEICLALNALHGGGQHYSGLRGFALRAQEIGVSLRAQRENKE